MKYTVSKRISFLIAVTVEAENKEAAEDAANDRIRELVKAIDGDVVDLDLLPGWGEVDIEAEGEEEPEPEPLQITPFDIHRIYSCGLPVWGRSEWHPGGYRLTPYDYRESPFDVLDTATQEELRALGDRLFGDDPRWTGLLRQIGEVKP